MVRAATSAIHKGAVAAFARETKAGLFQADMRSINWYRPANSGICQYYNPFHESRWRESMLVNLGRR